MLNETLYLDEAPDESASQDRSTRGDLRPVQWTLVEWSSRFDSGRTLILGQHYYISLSRSYLLDTLLLSVGQLFRSLGRFHRQTSSHACDQLHIELGE